jgi:hypothetical protein
MRDFPTSDYALLALADVLGVFWKSGTVTTDAQRALER